MSHPRLLVIEGNTKPDRHNYARDAGSTPSEAYAATLRALAPGAVVDIGFPGDGAALPDAIESYDGAVITGSALNIYDRDPEALRQIDCARAIFDSGIPFFGSCWGLQVATVAAGGAVHANPRGSEVGIARRITLTDAGRDHPLHAGRPSLFDAPAVHRDEVSVLPPDATVTAQNEMSAVQAIEIRSGKGVFWGVQYHPEFTLREVAVILRRYGMRLVEGGFFVRLADLETYCTELEALDAEPARKDLAWRHGFGSALLDPVRRTGEIANWLAFQVRPGMAARGRG